MSAWIGHAQGYAMIADLCGIVLLNFSIIYSVHVGSSRDNAQAPDWSWFLFTWTPATRVFCWCDNRLRSTRPRRAEKKLPWRIAIATRYFEDCWYWEEGYLYKIDYLNFLLFLLLYYSKREKSFFSIYIVWFQRLFSIFFIFDIVIFCNVFQFFLLLNSACYVAIYRLRNYWSSFHIKRKFFNMILFQIHSHCYNLQFQNNKSTEK